jgi:hypothetical protein
MSRMLLGVYQYSDITWPAGVTAYTPEPPGKTPCLGGSQGCPAVTAERLLPEVARIGLGEPASCLHQDEDVPVQGAALLLGLGLCCLEPQEFLHYAQAE